MRIVERPQYNPFHDEDQYEMNQIRENRRYIFQNNRNYYPPPSRSRYNLTIQNDPESQIILTDEDYEIIQFIERDVIASNKCSQFFTLSTLIIISQVIYYYFIYSFISFI